MISNKIQKRSKLITKLDNVFSLYIRLRDSLAYDHKAFRCLACWQVKPFEQADCAHYINRKHMSLRYSEINCNACCRSCNRFDEGNLSGYRYGLIKKYGEEKVLLLESMKNEIVKYSTFEIQAFIKFYTGKIKEFDFL